MNEESLNEIKRVISHDPTKVIWAEQSFSASDFRHMRDRNDDYLKYIKEDIAHAVAERIFNLIRDGKKYVVQAEWFEHLPDSPTMEPMQYYFHGPKYTMGYRGHIAGVETLRRTEYEFAPPVISTMPTYRPPTWAELRQGVISRFKESFTAPNMAKIFYKQVIARIWYLPDVNPHHWGF